MNGLRSHDYSSLMDYISRVSLSLTETDTGNLDTANMRSVQHELSDCLASLEAELSHQETANTKLCNKMNKISGSSAEVADRIAKARKKEVMMAERVQLWVDHLQREGEKLNIRFQRAANGDALACSVSADLQYHIDMLVRKREAVDWILRDTKTKRAYHKAYLRLVKLELSELQKALKAWDDSYEEEDKAIELLKASKENLKAQLKEQQEIEMEAKLMCQHLERAMADIHKQERRGDSSLDVSSTAAYPFHVTASSDDTPQCTTQLAEHVLSDLRRLKLRMNK